MGWFAIVVFLVFAAVSCSDGVAVDQGVLNEPVDDAVVVDQAVSSEPVDLPSHGGPLRVNHGARLRVWWTVLVQWLCED